MSSLSQRTSRFIVALLLVAGICRADIILNSIEQGQYYDTGDSNLPLIHQYGAGRGSFDSPVANNLFVFNLSSVSDPVLSAELRIESNWYFSADPFETYTICDVSTDLISLMNGFGGISAFNDLQSGNTYGAIDISAVDNGTALSILLNAQAIQDINNSLGGQFAIGGTVSTLDMITPRQEFVFPFTDPDSPSEGVELVLTLIPEPSVLGFLLLGCGMLALRRRRMR
ncbi:MAG: PEP-CTERM sorting domain-containing protein [Spartobacteria bacterium]|nr:PEP-CTERM sorting domain-containing protein [Spartobacteria bacterium]